MKTMFSKQHCCLLGVILIGMFFVPTLPVQGKEFRTPLSIDWKILKGDWQRTDGNYMIRVEAVGKTGPVTVLYYNPAPVHVARSHTFLKNGLKGLFVKLEDSRYQGSTYTLYHDDKQDALVGFYYHGQLQKSFEVIFLRRKLSPN